MGTQVKSFANYSKFYSEMTANQSLRACPHALKTSCHTLDPYKSNAPVTPDCQPGPLQQLHPLT